MRLCYGIATVEQIREGVRRLSKAAKRLTAVQQPNPDAAPAAV
jgi:DNA-binding transcriptional MocR family regulator